MLKFAVEGFVKLAAFCYERCKFMGMLFHVRGFFVQEEHAI